MPYQKSVPLWMVIVVIAMLGGGMMTCHQRASKSIHDPSLWTNIHGDPLDAANDEMLCPDCGGWLLRQGGYDYKCRKCGARMQIKRDMDTGKYVWHR